MDFIEQQIKKRSTWDFGVFVWMIGANNKIYKMLCNIRREMTKTMYGSDYFLAKTICASSVDCCQKAITCWQQREIDRGNWQMVFGKKMGR